jgi:hypothetical protein
MPQRNRQGGRFVVAGDLDDEFHFRHAREKNASVTQASQ